MWMIDKFVVELQSRYAFLTSVNDYVAFAGPHAKHSHTLLHKTINNFTLIL